MALEFEMVKLRCHLVSFPLFLVRVGQKWELLQKQYERTQSTWNQRETVDAKHTYPIREEFQCVTFNVKFYISSTSCESTGI